MHFLSVSADQQPSRSYLLVAGDQNDLDQIQVLLATLPNRSYGQVFIEVQTEAQIVELSAPARVQISWLLRQKEFSGTSTESVAEGTLLMSAVKAWVAEFATDDPELELKIWLGGLKNPKTQALELAIRQLISHQRL